MDENFHININTIKMNRSIQSIILVCLLIGNVFTAPQNPAVATPGGAPAGGILPIALPIHALRELNSNFSAKNVNDGSIYSSTAI